jgi:hypothetical protein
VNAARIVKRRALGERSAFVRRHGERSHHPGGADGPDDAASRGHEPPSEFGNARPVAAGELRAVVSRAENHVPGADMTRNRAPSSRAVRPPLPSPVGIRGGRRARHPAQMRPLLQRGNRQRDSCYCESHRPESTPADAVIPLRPLALRRRRSTRPARRPGPSPSRA